MRSFRRKAIYWFWIKKIEFKYSILLNIYLFLYPKKFKEKETVIYTCQFWRIYYCQRSFKPYYYYLFREHANMVHTAIAEEDDLKKLPPVIKELFK